MILNVSAGRRPKPAHIVARCLTGPSPFVCLAAVVLLSAACGGDTRPSSQERLKIVATTAILADLMLNVGGNRLEGVCEEEHLPGILPVETRKSR